MKTIIFLHILVIALVVYFTDNLLEATLVLLAIIGLLELIFFNYLAYKIKSENKEQN